MNLNRTKFYAKGSPIHKLAVETDTEIGELSERRQRKNSEASSFADSLHHYAQHKKEYIGSGYLRQSRWAQSLASAIEFVRSGAVDPWNQSRALTALAGYESTAKEIANLIKQIEQLDAVYRQYYWSRFFLVTNNGGHIHSSMGCSTCRPSTMFVWLPQLSGLTEADAVAAQGEILCTVCYPSAPSAWTSGTSIASRAAVVAKQAEAAAKLSAAAMLSLSADGRKIVIGTKPYVDKNGEVRRDKAGEIIWHQAKEFKTARTAELWLGEAADWRHGRGNGSYWGSAPQGYTDENFDYIVGLLAAKKRVSVATVLAEVEKKRAAKAKKGW